MHDLTYMWNLKTSKQTNKKAHRYREQIDSCQRQGLGVGKIG